MRIRSASRLAALGVARPPIRSRSAGIPRSRRMGGGSRSPARAAGDASCSRAACRTAPWFEVLEDHEDTRAYGFVDGDDYVAVVDRGCLARPPRALSARVGARPVHVDRAVAGVRRGPGERRPRRRALRGVQSRDAAARVRILDRDGRLVDEVPLPERGVVAEHAFSGNYKIFPPIEGGSVVACGESFTFTFASPGRSPATYSTTSRRGGSRCFSRRHSSSTGCPASSGRPSPRTAVRRRTR